jgi:FkbM family methyltransferase
MGNFPLTSYVYGSSTATREPVTVFDVGCSGSGLENQWNIFGPSLAGVGFDPLEQEIERLRTIEVRSNVTYEAAYVGLNAKQRAERDEYEKALSSRSRHSPNFFARSSASRAASLTAFDYNREYYNSGAAPRFATRYLSLDDYSAQYHTEVDFLKSDTDGFDMQVLLGAEKLLRSSILALKIECIFHGSMSRYANTMANIDAFLRGLGFSIYTIQPFCYTRAALPGPFYYDLLAQTKSGALVWADAVFMRDLADLEYETIYGFSATPERVLKLACFMEILELPDCAAELIIKRADRLACDQNVLLDRLVPTHLGQNITYREYIERFEFDPRALFPSRQRD